jgi:hypothetical protein
MWPRSGPTSPPTDKEHPCPIPAVEGGRPPNTAERPYTPRDKPPPTPLPDLSKLDVDAGSRQVLLALAEDRVDVEHLEGLLKAARARRYRRALAAVDELGFTQEFVARIAGLGSESIRQARIRAQLPDRQRDTTGPAE